MTCIRYIPQHDHTDGYFPNWKNSQSTTRGLMIGHALLSTNFNSRHSHNTSWYHHTVIAGECLRFKEAAILLFRKQAIRIRMNIFCGLARVPY